MDRQDALEAMDKQEAREAGLARWRALSALHMDVERKLACTQIDDWDELEAQIAEAERQLASIDADPGFNAWRQRNARDRIAHLHRAARAPRLFRGADLDRLRQDAGKRPPGAGTGRGYGYSYIRGPGPHPEDNSRLSLLLTALIVLGLAVSMCLPAKYPTEPVPAPTGRW